MFSTSSTTYASKYQSRCLASVCGDKSRHRFMVGTCSARESNEVQVLEFDEESNSLSCVGSLKHEGAVVALSPCPSDASVVATCGARAGAVGFEARVMSFDASRWGDGADDLERDSEALSDGEGPGVGVLGRDQPALTRQASNGDGGRSRCRKTEGASM